MSLQYLSDEKGHVVAVQVPIDEWVLLKSKYPDIDANDVSIPEWQKELIDDRLSAIKQNPERILPIDTLIEELDRS
ncbi:MAG: addiction module protein [Bacteroidota bacterium]